MSYPAHVEIEEGQLGPTSWAVIIWRGSQRSLWGRYESQVEAQQQKAEATEYLARKEEAAKT